MVKRPQVKEYLGIPIVPVKPPSTNQEPGLSFIESIKKYAESQAVKEKQQFLSSLPERSPKPMNQRIASNTALNQRVDALEQRVKGRKKGKKSR